MQKTIPISKWLLLAVVIAIIGGAWLAFGPPLPLGGLLKQTEAEGDTELEASAREVAMAILDLDYNDQAGWKDRLYPLCTAQGQQFWEDNLSNGMWEALGIILTDEVVVSTIEVQSVEQGLALVVVRGQTVFHDDGNENAQTRKDFLQMLVLQGTEADWRFVALVNT
jgi:hypothetical protein